MWKCLINSKTLPLSLLNLKVSLSLIFYPNFKFISNSHLCCHGRHPECSHLWPSLSLSTSAKPPSGLLPRDYCNSFPTGLASIPVPFPPSSESLWYFLHPAAMWSFYITNHILELSSPRLFSGLWGLDQCDPDCYLQLLSFTSLPLSFFPSARTWLIL